MRGDAWAKIWAVTCGKIRWGDIWEDWAGRNSPCSWASPSPTSPALSMRGLTMASSAAPLTLVEAASLASLLVEWEKGTDLGRVCG